MSWCRDQTWSRNSRNLSENAEEGLYLFSTFYLTEREVPFCKDADMEGNLPIGGIPAWYPHFKSPSLLQLLHPRAPTLTSPHPPLHLSATKNAFSFFSSSHLPHLLLFWRIVTHSRSHTHTLQAKAGHWSKPAELLGHGERAGEALDVNGSVSPGSVINKFGLGP